MLKKNIAICHWLCRQLRSRELLPALLAALAAGLTGLTLLGAAAWLITRAALQPPLYTLTIGITLVRAAGISRAAFRYAERWLTHRLAFASYTRLQLALYDRARELLPSAKGRMHSGLLLDQLLRGGDLLRDFYIRGLLPPLTNGLLTLAAVWALCSTAPAAALLLAGLYFLLGLLPWLTEPAPSPLLTTRTQENPAAPYRQALLDALAGRSELCSAAACTGFTSRLDAAARRYGRAHQQQAADENRTALLSEILLALSFTALTLLLYAAALDGRMDFITLGVWLIVLLALSDELRSMPAATRNLRQALVTAAPLLPPPVSAAATAAPPAAATIGTRQPASPVCTLAAAPDGPPLLEARQLSFAYPGSRPPWQGLDFCIHPGQHTAIIGESGAGKTTLGYLLTALYAPSSGRLALNGLPYATCTDSASEPCLTPLQVRRLLPAALQGSYIFSSSLRDNFLRLHPSLTTAEIEAALHLAQLDHVVAGLPDGLDTPLGPDGARLSGGQRSRLLTALALARPAPLLLLDEPTAGLDAATATALMTSLLQEADRRQQTLVIITHDLPLLERLPQVIKL